MPESILKPELPASCTEIFEEQLFPVAIVVGCPPEEFWYGDPKTFWIYAKAYKSKMKQRNFMEWLQGRYFVEAIASCFGKNYQYPQKPYNIFDTPQKRQSDTLELYHGDTNRQLIDAQVIRVQSYFKNQKK